MKLILVFVMSIQVSSNIKINEKTFDNNNNLNSKSLINKKLKNLSEKK